MNDRVINIDIPLPMGVGNDPSDPGRFRRASEELVREIRDVDQSDEKMFVTVIDMSLDDVKQERRLQSTLKIEADISRLPPLAPRTCRLVVFRSGNITDYSKLLKTSQELDRLEPPGWDFTLNKIPPVQISAVKRLWSDDERRRVFATQHYRSSFWKATKRPELELCSSFITLDMSEGDSLIGTVASQTTRQNLTSYSIELYSSRKARIRLAIPRRVLAYLLKNPIETVFYGIVKWKKRNLHQVVTHGPSGH
jgi:hypothetical protein